jgi:hypothetical protein
VSIASNTDYYTLTSGAKLNWIFWNGFTLQIDATYKKYGGLSSDYNQNFTLLNTGFGKKFLHNRAEFRLTAYDLLNKGTQITRTITANQITDKISNTLSRYFLLSFTYNFRSSKSNGNPDEGQRGEGHYRGDRPMGPPQGPPPGE